MADAIVVPVRAKPYFLATSFASSLRGLPNSAVAASITTWLSSAGGICSTVRSPKVRGPWASWSGFVQRNSPVSWIVPALDLFINQNGDPVFDSPGKPVRVIAFPQAVQHHFPMHRTFNLHHFDYPLLQSAKPSMRIRRSPTRPRQLCHLILGEFDPRRRGHYFLQFRRSGFRFPTCGGGRTFRRLGSGSTQGSVDPFHFRARIFGPGRRPYSVDPPSQAFQNLLTLPVTIPSGTCSASCYSSASPAPRSA